MVHSHKTTEVKAFLPKRSPRYLRELTNINKRITNLIESFDKPYPELTFSYINGLYTFLCSHIFDTKIQFVNIHPGEIIEVSYNGDFIVATDELPLLITKVMLIKKF